MPLFLLIIFLAACAPVKHVSVFENKRLAVDLTFDQYQRKRNAAYNQCQDEALKIPLPDYPKIATHESLGSPEWRVGGIDQETERAYHATLMDRVYAQREKFFNRCMESKGWKAVRTLNPEWVKWREDKE